MTTDTSEPKVDRPPGLAGQYTPLLAERDEMLEPDGALRPHWRPFVSMMDDMGAAQVLSRWEQARRLIRENGITHNVYGEANGLARPWNLDLVPLLMPAENWQLISDAMIQRARLLNALLADLYGPAESVLNGLLPPELLYANPWFLRPVHGIVPPGGQWIHLYAADLVRCADGEFRVLADRTQAPSGAGYCLENRIVLSRALPSVFRECNVLRLAPFFIALRNTLAALAPAGSQHPRVVLLTPGPYNETYFEHAYLSRYLGYTLAQGNDLTVRDCRVYLKTLSGLERVDVILRRVDDDFCDPLELRAKSFLGVPGLLQAVREKTVAVANAIGSGILQVPAILPFLPGLCRHFLAEELKLASVATWWCGQASELKYVLENLGKLVIKPAFPMSGSDPIFGEELSKAHLEALAEKIKASPREYVAQERLTTFAAPVLMNRASEESAQVQSRRFVVRAYAAAMGDSYTVMPGALTRVPAAPDSLVVSLQKGGGAKDTWILSQGPVSQVTLLAAADKPVEISRGGGDLSSRVADDLYWLGRYAQRAESIVRLARSVFNRLTDPNMVESPQAMEILTRELIGWSPRPGSGAARRLAAELLSVTDPGALRASIGRVHNLARVLRDRISHDAWQIVSEIERELSEFGAEIGEDQTADLLQLLNKLVAGFLALSGMVSESMTRGQSWQFMDLGMRIERGVTSTRLIAAVLVQQTQDEPFLLDALLETADSALTYRRRYLTQLQTAAVADLLLADESNPRSVAYQAAAIERHLSNLPGNSQSTQHQAAVKLCALLRLADVQAICQAVDGRRDRLESLGRELLAVFGSISDQVSQIFFSHAAAADESDLEEGERVS
jgi:uncharacterized circularly permuted ATP-grasp superfamily protein/uncharacterized alpha-E superfamily protein